VRNRTIKAATYENLARRGQVTDELIDFHVQHASGGVGITTVAYCAVARGRPDGHRGRLRCSRDTPRAQLPHQRQDRPWAAHCFASPTWSTASKVTLTLGRFATTTTNAWSRSSKALDAC
jgi:hypothetical protein